MNIPHRRPDPVKRYEDRLSIPNARRLADRYRNLNAYKLASSCISRLCDRIEELGSPSDRTTSRDRTARPNPSLR